MEPRTAPQWIREAETRYQRAHRMWVGATAAPLVALLGLAFGGALLHAAWLRDLAPWCAVALIVWRPDYRARRYGDAANAVNVAIVRYDVSADRPESTLAAADRRAQETARVQRIRTAPGWIREKRRSYLLRILRWISPVLLALALAPAAAALHWPWAQSWGMAEVYLLLLAAVLAGRSKLLEAHAILGRAIERYEYESAATEGVLDEADRRASGVLLGQ
jgi:hypothetical protein